MTQHRRRRPFITLITLLSLLPTPGGLLAAPAAAGQTRTAAPAAPAAPAATPAADPGWPRSYETPSGALMTVYQPQVASWEQQKKLAMYAAVAYTAPGAKTPALGTVKAEADTKVAMAERLVDFSVFTITEVNFTTLPKTQAQEIATEIARGFPVEDRIIALDRVLAGIDSSSIIPRNVEGVKSDPPRIFFSTTPAAIVNIDGPPVWSPIEGSDLTYAINTNWDLFEHAPSKTFYLRNERAWLKATSAQGPWAPAGPLPASFSKLPANDNWNEVRASLPGQAGPATRIFVSTTPAELILLTGAPAYQPVPYTRLFWVSNTESDVFRLGAKGPVYYLVAGRWFSAPDFNGPWTFATPSLPGDFSLISLEHPRSRVLASVPGTAQAAEAVLLAQIPQTARVNRKAIEAPTVEYQGAPEFQPVAQTSVARAVNTDKDVIKVGDLYYLCFQGVWFMSKSATGPWAVASTVPPQIYEIPISSPSHSVTYVTVEDSDDEWVTFAAAGAYTGMMVAWGCAVWGSGYYYPPYIGYGGFYPVYYPFYPTYGYSAWYNPWTGGYGRGAAIYGPYGGAGVAARYNPRTGTYARGAAAWGPYGGAAVGGAYNPRTGTVARAGAVAGPYGTRGAAAAYNPRTGASGATRQGSGPYGSWGSTAVQRGDQWASTSRVTNRATGTTSRVTRTDNGAAVTRRGPDGGGFVAGGQGGDVYAGRDGNVYRKQGDSWQKYENGGWNGVDQPTQQQRDQARTQAQNRASGSGNGTVNQLDRDSAARREGSQRTQDAGRVHSGTGGASRNGGGTYRPSGGGRPGGGRPAGGGRRR